MSDGKDTERSDHGLFIRYYPRNALEKWGKPHKTSIRQPVSWPNTKAEC
jgi:hypothetical protein